MTSNILTTQKVTVAFFATLLALSPLVGFAQESDRGGERFCSNLDAIEEQLKDRLSDRTDVARDKHQTQVDRYTDKKDERIQQLKDRRDQKDVTWSERIAALRDKAETDEQTQAIDDFVDTVEALIETRRDAVDAAIDAFEEDAKALRDERSTVFTGMVDTYKAEVEAAFDEAQALCDGGDDPADVRAELRSDLEAIRAAFKTDREQYNFREQFRELREVRIAATGAAREIFRTGFQAAKEILRAAFGG